MATHGCIGVPCLICGSGSPPVFDKPAYVGCCEASKTDEMTAALQAKPDAVAPPSPEELSQRAEAEADRAALAKPAWSGTAADLDALIDSMD